MTQYIRVNTCDNGKVLQRKVLIKSDREIVIITLQNLILCYASEAIHVDTRICSKPSQTYREFMLSLTVFKVCNHLTAVFINLGELGACK